jgi:hypothetical protein
VTEAEWTACTSPEAMLDFVQGAGLLTNRKARLFSVAVCRRTWHLLSDERSRRAVEVAERYADGEADEVAAAFRAADDAYWESDDAAEHGARTAAAYLASTTLCVAGDALATATATECRAELAWQADLLRDLFGNPFGPPPALDPSLLTNRVLAAAQAAYSDRVLPSGALATDRLAALAAALGDAGCQDAGLLGHLRGGGQHVRGCFALDLILCKS